MKPTGLAGARPRHPARSMSRSDTLRRRLPPWFPWALVVGAAAVFVVVGVLNLGFVRDDWGHYTPLRRIFGDQPFAEAVWSVVTNAWFGAHEMRVFFGSFLTHSAIAATGGAAETLIYTLQLGMHAAAACMVGWAVSRLSGSRAGGLVLASVLVVAPIVTQPAIWVNNLFFVQPWFFMSLGLFLWVVLEGRPRARAIALTACAVAAQFSGEALIAPLYVLLTLLAIVDWRRSRGRPSRSRSLAFVPVVVSAVLLVIYVAFVMKRPAATPLDWGALSGFGLYFQTFREQTIALLDINSAQYGVGGGVPVSGATWIAGGAVILLTALAVWVVPLVPASSPRRVAILLGCACLLVAVSFTPMMLGVVTGSRPAPDLRYQYAPGLFGACAVVLAGILCASLLAPVGRIALRAVAIGALAYASLVTTHNVIDVWGFQRAVDERIWSQVMSGLGADGEYLVTFTSGTTFLMPLSYSNAISDFQANWGMAGRVGWREPGRGLRVFSDAQRLPKGALALRDFYSPSNNACLTAAEQASRGATSTLYVIYQPSSTFAGLMSDPLLVTGDYAEFAATRDVMIARTGTGAWPVADAAATCA